MHTDSSRPALQGVTRFRGSVSRWELSGLSRCLVLGRDWLSCWSLTPPRGSSPEIAPTVALVLPAKSVSGFSTEAPK